jgi:hypothetical protein
MQGRLRARPLSIRKPKFEPERQVLDEFRQLDPRQRTR